VALGLGLALGLGRRRVAGDEAEPLGARGKAMAAKHRPHAVGRDLKAAPLRAGELGGDALGPEPRVGEREGEHPLLDHG
jgi:hypothetical protein